MIVQLVVIVVILCLLYLLLRHWPETQAPTPSQPGWTPRPKPVISGQPGESRSLVKSGWRLTCRWCQTFWQWLKHLFSDDHRPTSGQRPADEFDEFIGFKPGNRPLSRSDRVGRPPRQPGPLSPLRASQTPAPVKKTDWLGRPKEAPVETVPPSEAEVLLAKADAAKRNNNFSEAEKLLVRAAAKEPRNPKIYTRLGLLYLEQGENWAEAEESFKQALRFDGQNGFIHNNLGLVLYSQDRFAAAAKEFEAACRIDDAVASRHANLGLCYLSMRQYAKAEQEFKRAVRLDARNAEYAELLAEAVETKRRHAA